MSESSAQVAKTKRELQTDSKIMDLGPLKFFLGIKFERSADGRSISVTQEKYTDRVLGRLGMNNSRQVNSPMAVNSRSLSAIGTKDDLEREEMSQYPYLAALGCLLYISRRTRPEICYAVSLLCRVSHDPALDPWTAGKRILR